MDSEMSLSNMVLSFLEDAGTERWPENDAGDDDDGAGGGDNAESKAFWQDQHSQLHVSLPFPFDRQSSPSVSRVGQEQTFILCLKTTMNIIWILATRNAADTAPPCMIFVLISCVLVSCLRWPTSLAR